MDEHLAVLPIGESGARFQRLMAGVGRGKGLIQNQRGILEAGVHVAVGPLVRRLAHGQAAFLKLGEIGGGPFEFSQVGRRRARRFLTGLGWCYWRLDPYVALQARVRTAGAEAVEGIDHEGQMLELDLNFLDCLGGGQLVHSRDRQDRLALRSEEHTSELQSLAYLVCRLLLEKKKKKEKRFISNKQKKKKKL